MPRLPRIRATELAGLAEQLKFAPPATARRHVERCEELLGRLDAAQVYPLEWIVLQVTGYRPDGSGSGELALLPGEALLADLGALTERLSVNAHYTEDELPAGEFVSGRELARAWGISVRTLDRLRRAGLPGRRVTLRKKPGKRVRIGVVFRASLAEAVRARLGERVTKAAKFSRMAPEERARAAEIAGAMGDVPRAKAARAAAAALGRSPSAVARLLAGREKDRGAGRAGVNVPRLAWRALRLGIAASAIGARLGVSAASVERAVRLHRLDRLRGLNLEGATPGVEWSARSVAMAEAALTHAVCLRGDVAGREYEPTVPGHVAAALRRSWPDPLEEQALARGFVLLRKRAAEVIAGIDRLHPSAQGLDEAETLLRWATQLKGGLAIGQQMLLLSTVQANVGTALQDLAPERARDVLTACMAALAEAIDRHDPERGGRLAAPAGLAMSKAVTRWMSAEGRAAEGDERRAQRVGPAAVVVPDWTARLCPWQAWLDPDPAVVRAVAAVVASAGAALGNKQAAKKARGEAGGLSPADGALLARRFGLLAAGVMGSRGRPETLADLERDGLGTLNALVRRQRTAERLARRSGRV